MVQFVRPFVAKVALLRGQAVILDTSVRGQVDLPGAANAAIIGFAANDAAADQEVSVYLGGCCKAIAGASFGIGDYLMGEGTDGRLKEYVDDNTNQHACAIALEDGADGQLVDVLITHFKAETALT